MRKRITWPLLPAAVSLMALLTFCPLTPVSADKPTIVFIPVDETFLIPGGDNPCGFDIVEHVEGRVKLTLNSDNPHQALFAQGDHLHGTLTNPLNGNSISFVTAERITAVASSDGASVILTITGLQGRATVRGQGLVAADVGRLVLFFPCMDFQCDPEVLFSAGPMVGGPFPTLCDLLSD